jgi:hypothetical protein
MVEPEIMNNVQTNPSTISAKFSGGPKRMATGGDGRRKERHDDDAKRARQ